MANQHRVGIIGRIKVLVGRCPRCGERLERHEAMDQSFVHTLRTRWDGFERANEKQMPRVERRVIPVYAVCPRCEFRVRRSDRSETV